MRTDRFERKSIIFDCTGYNLLISSRSISHYWLKYLKTSAIS